VAGEVTATQPGTGSTAEMPTDVPAPADQPASDAAAAGQASADFQATTSDDAVSAQPDQPDLPDLADLVDVPGVPGLPNEPDHPAEANPAPDVASVPAALSTEELAAAGQPPPEPARTEQPTPAGPLPESELAGILTSLTALKALGGRLDDIANAVAEVSRLRSRDADLIARLHEDITRLRSGEIAIALNPVVTGMIKLHDQMVSLGALDDPASPVGMLRTQLLQIMELTCAVKPFTPAPGEPFDASRHTGARRIPTTDASADGTIASTIKVGFARADGSVVRVAEVEVHRLSG
jgi:hypothetical protein